MNFAWSDVQKNVIVKTICPKLHTSNISLLYIYCGGLFSLSAIQNTNVVDGADIR